jgi:hypothetical protein
MSMGVQAGNLPYPAATQALRHRDCGCELRLTASCKLASLRLIPFHSNCESDGILSDLIIIIIIINIIITDIIVHRQ